MHSCLTFCVSVWLVFSCLQAQASTVVTDATEIMRAVCTNEQLYKEASDNLRFGTDAEGNFIIKSIGKVAASLGFEYKSKDQSGIANTLKPEDLAVLAGKQSECNEKFIPFLMETLSQSAQRSPKAVAIDSKSYANKNGVSNATAIAEIIRNKNIEVFDIPIRDPSNWDPSLIRALNPEIVFLHWSAFETEAEPCSIDRTDTSPSFRCNKRFFYYFSQLARQTDAQFVIYTRTPSACLNIKSMMTKAISRNALQERDLRRAVLIEMKGSGKSIAAEREGSFTSIQSKTDVSDLVDLLLTTDGISKIISKYSSDNHGICSFL